MIRKYHNHKPQTTPWHREEEPLNHHETPGRQIKQSNQLSLPHQDDCNTRMGIKQRTTKHRTITDSHNGSNNKQKVNNNRTTKYAFWLLINQWVLIVPLLFMLSLSDTNQAGVIEAFNSSSKNMDDYWILISLIWNNGKSYIPNRASVK